MSKLFVIFGATGQQGGALVNYILDHPEFSKTFRLRAITRNASSTAAAKLKQKSVEIVEANLDDPETLHAAVAGAYAVFSVTNYWEKARASVEIAQGKALADAAVAAGVTLFIWSSLPNVKKITNGKLTEVHHFDSKAEVEEYIRGLSFPSSVFFLPGWFMQNVWNDLAPKPKKISDQKVLFPFAFTPETRIPLIDISDIGKYLAPALRDPLKYNGCQLTASTAFYTAQEQVETWSEVSGKQVVLPSISEIPLLTDDPIKQKVSQAPTMLSEWSYYGPTGQKDLEWTLEQVDEKLTTWREFLEANGPWFEDDN
ncbi:NmrA-like family-domain-containing protein [Talaromyces proteolyticus]|uniref:NmrA-like family-domain-containing protein n=1 Tax=Talaromyces proteolyticus TaxID=1131652 RepID=A0AAD4PYZ6_9EURO|nr:NmrA-like family-domain-containing protein [Talaromyces proteolyticus]KAH8698471.1 NmrA-like family-domain-containing protein [Talaromyces proteolyticus]